MFTKLGLKKEIPGTPPDVVPVHERRHQIFSTNPMSNRVEQARFEDLMKKAAEEKDRREREKGTGTGDTKEGGKK